jgi:hypothetical protein
MFRERHFAPAGNTVVSAVPIDIMVVAYGGGDKPERNAKTHGGILMTGSNHKNAPLQWSVFVTKRPGLNRELPPGYESLAWVPNSSTLIYGERDAVLVDTFLTAEASQALADWVAASGKNLTTIYATHGHGDHFFGIGLLKQRFPVCTENLSSGVVVVKSAKDGA